MQSTRARLRTVTREEAEKIAGSGLSARTIWLWCLGLVLIPTLLISVALAMFT
ncbi:MAG: hypothetical protein ACYTGB_13855 [Planctomycetota bacterium]|jgi:hypothetical protein